MRMLPDSSEVHGIGFWGGRSHVVALTLSGTESMVTITISRFSSLINYLALLQKGWCNGQCTHLEITGHWLFGHINSSRWKKTLWFIDESGDLWRSVINGIVAYVPLIPGPWVYSVAKSWVPEKQSEYLATGRINTRGQLQQCQWKHLKLLLAVKI